MAWVVALSYGLAPGFASLIGFDFHEVALAVSLLALSMAAMLRGDHRAAVLWALPLLLVKEDLGLTVAALGAVVFLRGSRRWGSSRWASAPSTFVVLLVLGAAAHPAGRRLRRRATRRPASRDALADPGRLGGDNKIRTVLYLLIPTGLVALRSPMLLLVARADLRAGGSSPTAAPTGIPGTSTTPSWCRSRSPR